MTVKDSDIKIIQQEERELKARAILAKYCVSKSHYRYHKCLKGICYKIPMEDAKDLVAKSILLLLSYRKVVMSLKDKCYILYGNENKDIGLITTDLSKEPGGLWGFCDYLWTSISGGIPFSDEISLQMYFEHTVSVGFCVSEIVDIVLKESYNSGSDNIVVLSSDPTKSYFKLLECEVNNLQ